MKKRVMLLTAALLMFMTMAHASAVLARIAAKVTGAVNAEQGGSSTGPAAVAVKPEKKRNPIELVRGIIVSVDSVKSEIVIKDAGTSKERVLKIQPGGALLFKKGDRIKAKVYAGTNLVEAIKRMDKKKSK